MYPASSRQAVRTSLQSAHNKFVCGRSSLSDLNSLHFQRFVRYSSIYHNLCELLRLVVVVVLCWRKFNLRWRFPRSLHSMIIPWGGMVRQSINTYIIQNMEEAFLIHSDCYMALGERREDGCHVVQLRMIWGYKRKSFFYGGWGWWRGKVLHWQFLANSLGYPFIMDQREQTSLKQIDRQSRIPSAEITSVPGRNIIKIHNP